jgi:AcrR family transcriptional regulator
MAVTKKLKERGKAPTEARRTPIQARAKKRHEQILDITAELLVKVGVDELTTILIAKSAGISVGSLYHYFPNKIAILYALAQRWLDEINLALDDIEASNQESEDLEAFTHRCTERVLEVYRRQQGILHLVQAMFSIPELHTLDEEHDAYMIKRFTQMFARQGIEAKGKELERRAAVYLEVVHALSLLIVEQSSSRATRTTQDLKFMAYSALAGYHKSP